jgi:hypothetical protein
MSEAIGRSLRRIFQTRRKLSGPRKNYSWLQFSALILPDVFSQQRGIKNTDRSSGQKKKAWHVPPLK